MRRVLRHGNKINRLPVLSHTRLAHELSKRNKDVADKAATALTGLMASIHRKKEGFTAEAISAVQDASTLYNTCLALNNETMQVIAGFLDLKVETGEVAP